MGDRAVWEGTSDANLAQDQKLFSTLAAQNGTGAANFETAQLLANCSGGPPPCYANCDGSSIAPILNVNDFICF